MARNGYVLVSALVAVGLAVAACGGSGDSNTTTVTETDSETTTSTSAAPTTTTSPTAAPMTPGADLQSLIPTPADTQRTDGPESVHDNGIHKHFLVNGSPADVMDAYKAALEGAGWTVAVENAGGGEGGGGATYVGTHGDAYGVFGGGGYGSTTDVNACAWPTKPAKTHCGD